MRLPRRAVLVSALAYLVACSGGDSGTGPTQKIPTNLGVSAGNNQSAEVATAFRESGIVVREDFGEIVFHLVEAELLSKTEEDRLEDFRDVYAFEDAFNPARIWDEISDSCA